MSSIKLVSSLSLRFFVGVTKSITTESTYSEPQLPPFLHEMLSNDAVSSSSRTWQKYSSITLSEIGQGLSQIKHFQEFLNSFILK